jgi:GT2 family glycosyltransferase
VPAKQLIAAVDLAFRSRIARKLENEVFLQGANMAIRRSAWLQVRRELCEQAGLHEDFDLAIHLQALGLSVGFCPELKAEISGRCINDSARSFYEYAMLSPVTYARHGLRSQRHMYPLVAFMVAFQVPLRTLYRAYDSQSQQFMWRGAFRTAVERVNPATFAD